MEVTFVHTPTEEDIHGSATALAAERAGFASLTNSTPIIISRPALRTLHRPIDPPIFGQRMITLAEEPPDNPAPGSLYETSLREALVRAQALSPQPSGANCRVTIAVGDTWKDEAIKFAHQIVVFPSEAPYESHVDVFDPTEWVESQSGAKFFQPDAIVYDRVEEPPLRPLPADEPDGYL